jgi:hypothetical protein
VDAGFIPSSFILHPSILFLLMVAHAKTKDRKELAEILTQAWSKRSVSFCVAILAATPVPPPAKIGTTTRMGLVGYAWARIMLRA